MFAKNVSPEARRVLEKLLSTGVLSLHKFYLAGGTGLALHLGHRISEDLDFFTGQNFEPEKMVLQLRDNLDITVIDMAPGTLHLICEGVTRTSFLYYPYRVLFPLSEFKGCPVADCRDIAAMKLIAIAQRGSKKDFVDLFFLLRHKIDLQQLKNIIERKYAGVNYSWPHLLRSIAYFEDAEEDPMPVLTVAGRRRNMKPAEWEMIKNYLVEVQKNAIEELRER